MRIICGGAAYFLVYLITQDHEHAKAAMIVAGMCC